MGRAQGYKHSEEAKAKMSATHKRIGAPWMKGRKFTLETRAKMSKVRTPETKAKMSKAKMGLETKGKNNNFYGRKHTLETKAKMSAALSGPNSPHWRGGLSKEAYPFEFDGAFKKIIRKRDGYLCRMCSKTQQQNGRALDVHHIDYNKNNLDPKNLISLCESCHTKTRFDRFFWAIELRQVS